MFVERFCQQPPSNHSAEYAGVSHDRVEWPRFSIWGFNVDRQKDQELLAKIDQIVGEYLKPRQAIEPRVIMANQVDVEELLERGPTPHPIQGLRPAKLCCRSQVT